MGPHVLHLPRGAPLSIRLAVFWVACITFSVIAQSRVEKDLAARLAISEAARMKALADLDAAKKEKDAIVREFKALHAADADLSRRIATNTRDHADLEARVGALDISVDTRLLVQATDDIKTLKEEQKQREDRAAEERKSNADMIRTIKTGTIMLVIGAAVSGIGAMFKIVVVDPRRRASAVQIQDAKQGQVLEAVAHGIRLSSAGIEHSNHLSEKLVEQAEQMVAMHEDLVTAVTATNANTDATNADREKRKGV